MSFIIFAAAPLEEKISPIYTCTFKVITQVYAQTQFHTIPSHSIYTFVSPYPKTQ